jgi:hypothetical protein
MEDAFLPFFQKEIIISLDNKSLRQGKLLLFSIKDFYLHFTLLINENKKCFEIPYPFSMYKESVSSSSLILDYKINTFTNNMPEIEDCVKILFKKEKHMKYFDNIVKIVEV